MNVLFLTIFEINSINERGIYTDLLRKFSNEGHNVTIITAAERRKRKSTNLSYEGDVTILQVRTLNIQKTNNIEKGVGFLTLEFQFLYFFKKYFSNKKFDLVLYSTPPITFNRLIEYVRNRDGARTYLLLKDIFPQNAIDMKMMQRGSFIHRFFEKKEERLYRISDKIGCMSEANLNYIIKNNRDLDLKRIEVNPNTIELRDFNISNDEKTNLRRIYGIPVDKKVFIYGGNLGKPQGLDFLIDTIESTKNPDVFFLIVGDGTEFSNINAWYKNRKNSNSKLIKNLPKVYFDKLLSACDIGLIFLDKNFTIPNFPSRLLSYLEMKKPVLAATDETSDIGDVIENAKCGYKVIAGDQDEMQLKIERMTNDDDLELAGKNAYKLLIEEYLVERSYNLIIR